MHFEISDQCSALVDSLGYRQLRPGRGFVTFAVDTGADSKANSYPIDLPTDLIYAQGMLDLWGNRPVCDPVAMTRDMVEFNSNTILDRAAFEQCLSCWMVAWLYGQGKSLEEQVELSSQYARLFVVQGRQYTFCLANSDCLVPR